MRIMSKLTIRGSVGCFILTFAAGVTTGCSTANRSSPARPGNATASARVEQPIEEDDAFLQPASASLASTRREASSRPMVAADPIESPDDSQDAARAKSESMARHGEPGCAMHAENTPSGIAVIFTAGSSSPDRVAAQARALAAELERERLEAAGTEVEPSTFGTRQIAELAAQTFV